MGSIEISQHGSVLELSLVNAGKANAIDLTMLRQLDAAVARVQADTAIRVVLLRGNRGGAFSSGADIREWAPMAPEVFARDWIAFGNTVLRRFEHLRCPSVAAIEGLCFGGGLELALCADLRIASTAARFRFPETGIGAIPGWEGGPRLARVVGRGRALEAVLCGREIDAHTGLQWGLLNAVHAPDAFEPGLRACLDPLAAVSPAAAALAKAAVLVGESESEIFHAQAACAIKASPDAEIGIQAFLAKRQACF